LNIAQAATAKVNFFILFVFLDFVISPIFLHHT